MAIGIIGAGLAGLTCAARLVQAGHRVVLFDKGRSVGGRMATRRMPTPLGDVSFDHGAQYFTARDPRFRDQVTRWERDGIVARWPAAGPDAWVGTPGMRAPTHALAADLDIRSLARVDTVELRPDGWHLTGDGIGSGSFGSIIIAVPAEQAARLVGALDPGLSAQAADTRTEPCWTVMAAFARPLTIVDDVVKARGPIGWAARDSSKPGRGETESWVIQATPDWSRQHLEDTPAEVLPRLLAALREVAGGGPIEPIAAAAHRWRYARSGRLGRDVLWNNDDRIGLCGDWLLGPRVECAWLSGLRLAEHIAQA